MRYLGIDGGGTKTTFLLLDEYYNEICHVQSGPSNYLSVGPEVAKASIVQGISELTERPNIVCGGFAGAGRPEGLTFYKDVLHSILPDAQIIIETDAFIAYMGVIGIDPGLLLIAGTGSIVIGRDLHHAMFRVGGWGPHFGDEGSGFWIGREAIRAALRAVDAQEPTEFPQRIATNLGLKSIHDVIGAWANNKLGVPEVAGLFPEVVSMYPSEPAKQILTDAAYHLRSLIQVAGRRVGIDNCRKSLSGSVASHPVMRELIGLEFDEARHSPAWGAVIWAHEHSPARKPQ
jgi:glucosamine kinase